MMAFQSYDELIKMATDNPKQASSLVRAAQQRNIPVVSAENPGYKNDPRMNAMRKKLMQQFNDGQDSNVTTRKNMSY